jgi:peptidoglycan/xylan/chitin deacetylase (PgdA/CDA1 family)
LLLLGLVCGITAPVPVEAAPVSPLPGGFNEFITAAPAPANSRFLYIPDSGHGIIGPILRFYTRTGGADRHGKPLSEPLRVGNHYIQYFERSALEFYPEYSGTGTEVRFAPLGQLAASQAKLSLQPGALFAGTPNDWYFPGSGHSLREPFLTYWRNEGDLSGLGWPISEELTQDGPDGARLTVQYFENVELVRPADSLKVEEVSLAPLGALLAKQLLTPAQLAPVARERFSAPRTVKVPSLMFHYAREVDPKKDLLGFNLSIKPDNYVKFLDWVQANGYNTVTIGQIYDYLQYGILLPDKPVNFRWDDGHDNNWFVYQEMKKRGMTATFYVITQRLELLPAQWQQIDRDGFEVAAHTRTHPDLRAVKDLTGEVAGSKKDLETILGHPVRNFAYPYGYYNNTVRQVVQDSGFEIAVTTHGGYTWTSNLKLEEPTISVTGNDTLESFAGKIKAGTAAPVEFASDNSAGSVKSGGR